MEMNNQRIKYVNVCIPVKSHVEGEKYRQNNKIASMLEEKYGSRLKIRSKLDKIFSSYLSDIKLLLPLSTQIKLHEKLINLLGFSFLYFCTCIIISIIPMLIC
jgi:hypothetical protein